MKITQKASSDFDKLTEGSESVLKAILEECDGMTPSSYVLENDGKTKLIHFKDDASATTSELIDFATDSLAAWVGKHDSLATCLMFDARVNGEDAVVIRLCHRDGSSKMQVKPYSRTDGSITFENTIEAHYTNDIFTAEV